MEFGVHGKHGERYKCRKNVEGLSPCLGWNFSESYRFLQRNFYHKSGTLTLMCTKKIGKP